MIMFERPLIVSNCYLQTQTVYFMKLKIVMFMISVLKISTYFTFSGYPKDSVYHYRLNKKVLGKMEDELNGNKIVEFVGLKSKMYSLIADNDKKSNKAKGVNKKLRHKEYVDILFNKNVVRHKMKRIQSQLHEIVTYDLNKISLSFFDDKRHVLDDGIFSIFSQRCHFKTLMLF